MARYAKFEMDEKEIDRLHEAIRKFPVNAEAIINDIKSLNSTTREPNFLQRAGAFGENDFGNTYIEINLTDQHLYAYKDGNKIVDCDIIKLSM